MWISGESVIRSAAAGERSRESSASSEAHRAAKRGTLRERRDYVDARRAAARARDKRRRRLARRDSASPVLAIDRDRGFATVDPDALSGIQPVVADALALMQELGPTPPSSGKDHLTTNLLPGDSLALDSSFLRLALDDPIVSAVSDYLGLVPVLNTVDVWHSRPVEREAHSSQLFHLDNADLTQVKVFVHCTDVTEASGPLTVLDAASSARLARKLDYRIGNGRVADQRVVEVLGDRADPVGLTGPPGTVHLVDTSRCFHFGSRVESESPPRTVVVFQYLTPYAFAFLRDHREEAPFRHLASEELPERQRLVLGVD
jgi:hypothetical protein